MSKNDKLPAKAETKSLELFDIKELKEKKRIPDSIHQGIMVAEGWKPFKMVTELEYETALDKFLNLPIGGKKVNKVAKGR